MDLAERMTRVLAPHLGAHTADSVARHFCAKHALLGEGPVEPARVRELQETIRRGLVAFVGPEKAQELANSCFSSSP